ncbi:uncharacterized protein A4U43_C01F34870 [Asparagus officinalis]|uniref:U3 small nucleolar RNA-associated protein 13 C-terminal domain-containing protein n=1 Tax=Asparagus officinalis TaxID=4686 RepID=A0A5P1FX16_ASPOF|nr:uncharacterized protein A4U43_C01F34870 [Asparagus officinalis]
MVEVKGVCELLEGLIPYSQRHFSRVDRLVRSSTFLLDYVLVRMSVLDPDINATSSKSEAILPSDNRLVSSNNGQIDHKSTNENGSDDKMSLPEMEEKASSKKRKSSKSKKSGEKKAKLASQKEVSAISVGA